MKRVSIISIFTFLLGSALLAQTKDAAPFTPGESVYGSARFIEYVAGDLPIIIAIPHGGELVPEILPDRTRGVNYTDGGTQELARMISDEFRKRTGKTPHLIINRLKRRKLDANREIEEAAQGSEVAERAWREYHSFIDTARKTVHAAFGAGLFIDLHGHANDIPRVELGYALTSEDLAQDDATLNDFPYADMTTIVNLLRRTKWTHAQVLRDSISFGAMLAKRGIAACPSPQDPKPNDESFYAGGYSVRRHTVEDSLNMFGVQIELPVDMRNHDAERRELTPKITEAIIEFVRRATDLPLPSNSN